MRLEDERESQNIDDQRGQGGGLGGGFGGGFGRGGGGIPVLVGGGGLGTVAIIVIALLLGVDPSALFQDGGVVEQPRQERQVQERQGQERQGQQGKPGPSAGQEDAQRQFVARVLATTEDTWAGIFQQNGRQYERPVLVLYSGAVQSGCGFAQAAMGPFYCPGDHRLYLDTSFFVDMERKLGAPGEFARAYVIAHEVGHHVQNLMGIAKRVDDQRRRAGETEANALSVRLELQADCFAGVWAYQTNQRRPFLDPGDIESGIGAAAAVGDDRLQQRSRGYVVPESFTHGSSAQRVRWFRRGFENGEVRSCDTFAAERL